MGVSVLVQVVMMLLCILFGNLFRVDGLICEVVFDVFFGEVFVFVKIFCRFLVSWVVKIVLKMVVLSDVFILWKQLFVLVVVLSLFVGMVFCMMSIIICMMRLSFVLKMNRKVQISQIGVEVDSVVIDIIVMLVMIVLRIGQILYLLVFEIVMFEKIDVFIRLIIIGIIRSLDVVVEVLEDICRKVGMNLIVVNILMLSMSLMVVVLMKIGLWNRFSGMIGFCMCDFVMMNVVVVIMRFVFYVYVVREFQLNLVLLLKLVKKIRQVVVIERKMMLKMLIGFLVFLLGSFSVMSVMMNVVILMGMLMQNVYCQVMWLMKNLLSSGLVIVERLKIVFSGFMYLLCLLVGMMLVMIVCERIIRLLLLSFCRVWKIMNIQKLVVNVQLIEVRVNRVIVIRKRLC